MPSKTQTRPKPTKAKAETPDDTAEVEPKKNGEAVDGGDGMLHVEWRGATFLVPEDQNQWPIRTMQMFSRRRYIDAVEILFGPTQFDLLMSRGRVHPGELTTVEFWEFFPLFAEIVGFKKPDDDDSEDEG
jgi:hypothetical protein